MSRFLACLAAVGLLLVALTTPGRAYSLEGQRWPAGANIVMHLQQGSSSGTLSDGSTSWNAVTEGALSLWNAQIGSVAFSVVRDSTADTGLRNNINNVIWGDDVYGTAFGDAIAVTRYLYRPSDNTMVESDVVFDRSRTWNSYRGNLTRASNGSTLLDLRRVALHEFGHVLGLDHPDQHGETVAAIMNSRTSNTDSLQADDIDGARAIYGASTHDTLLSGNRLVSGQSLVSVSARYRLLYQVDGNLVLYDEVDRVPLWSTGTVAGHPGQLVLQSDGNLVLYDAQGTVQWSTGTVGNANARLVLQNDGNVVLYSSGGQPLWNRLQ